MNRSLWFVGFAALVLAALVFVPLSGAWLPDRVATSFSTSGEAQGFAPRRAETAAFLRLHFARLGCVVVLFFAMLHGLTLQANLHPPARLPISAALAPMALFAMALTAWTIVLWRRFRAPG